MINFSTIFAYIVPLLIKRYFNMGRISRLYPKGRLRLRIPKMVQSGKKYPLYIEYNWHADSIRKSTGISVSVKEWNEKGYCGIGEIRATTDIDYKYYNHALHKRIEDIDVKIHKYYEMHQHITCDVIRSFLEDNDNALRPDEGKDFIEFAKELMEKRYEKGKIGFSTCKWCSDPAGSCRCESSRCGRRCPPAPDAGR